MSFIQNLFTSRDNNANAATYVGQEGRIWWNPDANAFYYSNGNTAGGIQIGGASTGNGVSAGPTNSIQYNAGGGLFGGTANLTIAGNGISVVGNTTSAYFIGDGSQLTNLPLGNYSGNISGGNIFITNTANLGNLTINDQTISGTVTDRDIIINTAQTGPANVVLYGNLIVSPEGVLPNYPPQGGVNEPVGWFVGDDGRESIVYIDSFSSDNPFGGPRLSFRRFAGTKATPVAVSQGQYLGSMLSRGFDGTDFQTNAFSGLTIEATQNFSPVQMGSQIKLWTVPAGSNTATTVASFKNDAVTLGNFVFFSNGMTIADTTANLTIGNIGSTGYLQSFRPFQVIANASGAIAFQVNRDGLTDIFSPSTISPTESALSIIGSGSGNVQPRNFNGTMVHVTGQDNLPTRISFDAFGTSGAQNSYAAIAARAARGTVDNPQALQANDLMMRITSQGWTGNGVYAPSIARLNFAAAETFTSNASVGTYANIQLTPIGSNIIKTITSFSANGVSFPNSGAGGTGNLGITFQDGTYQNTAYTSTSVVRSATAGSGITIAPTGTSATGNITITNTGIVGVIGTANQVIVTSNIAGVVTLGAPQNIGTSSNVIFQSLTVTDLLILGNVSNVIPSVVEGKVVYVANNAATLNDINNSGLVTGNVGNGYWSGMLFDTDTSTWDFNLGNSIGITAGNVYGNSGQFLDLVHVGFANATIDYPDASIQSDCNTDSYNQIVMQNHYQGANASADFVAVPNNGDDGNFYIDMGINSNVFNNSDYAAMGSNDGYLYVNGGDLIIGTQTPTKIITFITGGTNSATAYNRVTISDTGLSVIGNIGSDNMIANSYTGALFSVTGNITGGNVITTGTLSTTGNITGGNVTGVVVSASGNVIASNIRSTGNVSASGNVIGSNVIASSLVVATDITATGNISGGQLLSAGNLSASGNVTGTYVVATVAVNTVNINATGFVSAAGAVVSSDGITATGNVQAGNVRTTGLISATGGVTAASVVGGTMTGTSLSVSGNITGGNVLGGANVNATTHTGTSVSVSGTVTSASVVGGVITGSSTSVTGTTTAASVVGGVITGSSTSVTGTTTAASVVGGIITGSSSSVTGIVTGASVVGGVMTGTSLSVSGNITGGNVLGGANVNATTHTGTSVSVSGTVTSASVVGGVITGSSTSVTGSQTAASTVGGIITGSSSSVTGIVTGASVVGGVMTGSSTSVTGTTTAASVVGGVMTGSSISVSGAVTGASVTTAGVLTVNSGAAVSAIVNGATTGVGNIGSSTVTFNTVFAKATTAQYADLAEKYTADAFYAPGTVVVFGGNQEVTVNSVDSDTKVAGVVSTDPGFVMNEGLVSEFVASVALTGRVPCFVLGPVKKGDLMVAAGLGRARSEANPRVGTVIGKALEDFDGVEGTIEVVVGRF